MRINNADNVIRSTVYKVYMNIDAKNCQRTCLLRHDQSSEDPKESAKQGSEATFEKFHKKKAQAKSPTSEKSPHKKQ